MVPASRRCLFPCAYKYVVVGLGIGWILLPLGSACDSSEHYSVLLESEAIAAAHDARSTGKRFTSPFVFQRVIACGDSRPGRHAFHKFAAMGVMGRTLELGSCRAFCAVCICSYQRVFCHHIAGRNTLFLSSKRQNHATSSRERNEDGRDKDKGVVIWPP